MKHRQGRREFMGLAGLGATGIIGAPWLGGNLQAQDADLVVFNAKVYTVDSLAPRAEAFAVKGGRFVAVGSTEDIKAPIGKGTERLDDKQMTVLPGVIDCHKRAAGKVLRYEVDVGKRDAVEFGHE